MHRALLIAVVGALLFPFDGHRRRVGADYEIESHCDYWESSSGRPPSVLRPEGGGVMAEHCYPFHEPLAPLPEDVSYTEVTNLDRMMGRCILMISVWRVLSQFSPKLVAMEHPGGISC